MSAQQHDRPSAITHIQTTTRRGLEIALFLLASLVGTYGLGQGLAGLYVQGQQISLLWLALTGFAFFILFAQMGRVHDTWPHRPGRPGTSAPQSQEPTATTVGATLDTKPASSE